MPTTVGKNGTPGCPEPGPAISIEATNVSAKAILGYVISVAFYDSKKNTQIHTLTNLEASALKRRNNQSLPPGSSWLSQPKHIPWTSDGNNSQASVDIDLVIFIDGTTWGPAKTARSQLLSYCLIGKSLSACMEMGKAK
jgi:hypothetical protein